MRSILLDPASDQKLIRDGYCVLRLLSTDEAASLWDELAGIRLGGDFEGRNGGPVAYHASVLDPDLSYKRRAHEIVLSVLGPRLLKVLNGYRAGVGGVLAKGAGKGMVGLHRDWTMTADLNDVTLNAWCPLVDVDDTNGTLRVYPGSQRLLPNIDAPHTTPYFQSYSAELFERAIPVSMAAGEVLIYDTTLLHCSRANQSGNIRPVAACLCVPERSTLAFYRLDRASGGTRFEIFDMEDDGYVEHTASDFFNGTLRRPIIEVVEIQNRRLEIGEFDRLVACRKQ